MAGRESSSITRIAMLILLSTVLPLPVNCSTRGPQVAFAKHSISETSTDHLRLNAASSCACRIRCIVNISCTAITAHTDEATGNVTCFFSNVKIPFDELVPDDHANTWIHNGTSTDLTPLQHQEVLAPTIASISVTTTPGVTTPSTTTTPGVTTPSATTTPGVTTPSTTTAPGVTTPSTTTVTTPQLTTAAPATTSTDLTSTTTAGTVCTGSKEYMVGDLGCMFISVNTAAGFGDAVSRCELGSRQGIFKPTSALVLEKMASFLTSEGYTKSFLVGVKFSNGENDWMLKGEGPSPSDIWALGHPGDPVGDNSVGFCAVMNPSKDFKLTTAICNDDQLFLCNGGG